MKRRWIEGQTMGKHRWRSSTKPMKYETYYFVDDEHGGRRGATPLEVALWLRAVGAIPFGPDETIRPASPRNEGRRRMASTKDSR